MLRVVDIAEMDAVRALTSPERAVLRAESTTVSDDADVLNALDNASTALLRALISVDSMAEMDVCDCMMLVAKLVSPPIALASSTSVSSAVTRLGPATLANRSFTYVSVATTASLILGFTVKFHSPVANTLPVNAAFPTTVNTLNWAFAMLATPTLAAAMEALLTVASPITAFGMVADPVNVAASMGAFNAFNDASAAARSLISCWMTDVKLAKCVTMSAFVALPITMSVISVLWNAWNPTESSVSGMVSEPCSLTPANARSPMRLKFAGKKAGVRVVAENEVSESNAFAPISTTLKALAGTPAPL